MYAMQKDKVLELLRNKSKEEVLLATVSGVASTKPEMIRYFNDDVPAITMITTKSFQLKENPGNREPIICEPELGTFGNSVGLRNPGMKQALAELKLLREKKQINKLLNVSLSASSPQNFIELIKNFESVADSIELNFSCPHAASGFGASIGCDLNIAEQYVREIKTECANCSVPIFVKLTPNVPHIEAIAKACVEAGADGIVAINTVGPELYLEAHSKKPILNNKLAGKGGKSGLAVFETALNAIQKIRTAIGENVPIIGMGGLANGEQVAKLIQAGATVVGIGSALARVHQRDWPQYFEALKFEAQRILKYAHTEKLIHSVNRSSDSFLSKKPRMSYTEHVIEKIEDAGKDLLILKLSGEINYEAGEFVFLYLPDIGEKPFTVASSKPLSFMIKKRGAFTEACFKLKAGDKIYTRGLYGEGVKFAKTKKAILIAGGSGIAVLPKLAETLTKNGIEVESFVGTSDNDASETISNKAQNSIEEALVEFGKFTKVADNGKLARVLDVLEHELYSKKDSEVKDEVAYYIVGPTPFFTRAAETLKSFGVREKHIFLSLEKLTRCGVGLCGECSCGKKLTCQYGTFVTYNEYLESN